MYVTELELELQHLRETSETAKTPETAKTNEILKSRRKR
jgi:hypothetical protein